FRASICKLTLYEYLQKSSGTPPRNSPLARSQAKPKPSCSTFRVAPTFDDLQI
ncbi:unnamed protein product, partial [Amoebophrya sp. A120]